MSRLVSTFRIGLMSSHTSAKRSRHHFLLRYHNYYKFHIYPSTYWFCIRPSNHYTVLYTYFQPFYYLSILTVLKPFYCCIHTYLHHSTSFVFFIRSQNAKYDIYSFLTFAIAISMTLTFFLSKKCEMLLSRKWWELVQQEQLNGGCRTSGGKSAGTAVLSFAHKKTKMKLTYQVLKIISYWCVSLQHFLDINISNLCTLKM